MVLSVHGVLDTTTIWTTHEDSNVTSLDHLQQNYEQLPRLDHYHAEATRIKFEHHAKGHGLDVVRTTNMTNHFGADYIDGITEAVWRGWLLHARTGL
jgi:hypothetical protein